MAHRVIPNADVYSYFEAKMTYLVFRMYLPHYALASFLATVLLSLPAPQSPFPVRHVHPAVYTRRSSYRRMGGQSSLFLSPLDAHNNRFLRKYQTHYRSPAHGVNETTGESSTPIIQPGAVRSHSTMSSITDIRT